MRLFVATSNAGKLRDFAHAAKAYGDVEILPLPGMSGIAVPEEDADTFEGNARIKALAYGALLPGEIVIADDSGIVVPGLGGLPGVRSARYAEDEGFVGAGSLDERNLACLLDRAGGLEERGAFYVCVLTAAQEGRIVATAEGRVDGRLLREPKGAGGFGYDPIFLVGETGRTMAELGMEERMGFSHRGRALAAMIGRLKPCDAKIAQSHR